MRAVLISTARELGKRHGAKRLVVIAIDGADYGITTWGETRAECQALRRWAESAKAVQVVAAIAGAKPQASYVFASLEPDGAPT